MKIKVQTNEIWANGEAVHGRMRKHFVVYKFKKFPELLRRLLQRTRTTLVATTEDLQQDTN